MIVAEGVLVDRSYMRMIIFCDVHVMKSHTTAGRSRSGVHEISPSIKKKISIIYNNINIYNTKYVYVHILLSFIKNYCLIQK